VILPGRDRSCNIFPSCPRPFSFGFLSCPSLRRLAITIPDGGSIAPGMDRARLASTHNDVSFLFASRAPGCLPWIRSFCFKPKIGQRMELGRIVAAARVQGVTSEAGVWVNWACFGTQNGRGRWKLTVVGTHNSGRHRSLHCGPRSEAGSRPCCEGLGHTTVYR